MAAAEADWLTLAQPEFDVESFSIVWLLAVATYGVGDVVTTIAIVWFLPLYAEANPLIHFAVSLFGGGGFLAVKLLVFYGVLAISLWAGFQGRDKLMFYGPPIVLALVGLFTTVHNLALMFA
ncbi:MAG: hypothetical protein ABEI57_03000 [Halapricum sp.]